MTEPTNTGAPFDAHFILWLVGILSTGVISTIVGFIILGWVAFRGNKGLEQTFMQVFLGGEALRMLCVTGIIVAVLCLAFAKLIDGTVASSILSGMAGFVLGGVSRVRDRAPKSEGKGGTTEEKI